MLEQTKICHLGRLLAGTIQLITPTFTDPEGAQGGSFAKMRDFLDKKPPPSPRTKHTSKTARGTPSGVQDSDAITSLAPHSEQEVKAPERGALHRWHPRASSHASFPCLALKRESPRARVTGSSLEWRLQDKMGGDGIRSTFIPP